MQALIIYFSLTGNTYRAAKYIAKGLEEENVVVTRINVRMAKIEDIANKDIIIIGTPTWMGAPAMEIRRFLNKLPENALKNKKVAAFTTYTLMGSETTLSTIEEIAHDKGATIVIPGLARPYNILRNLWNTITGSTEDEEAWAAFGKLIVTFK